jgi:FtsP/CotA-like multicopper oxidase with cupredoxin domain
MPDSCAGGGEMSAVATNIHFHGLSIPAECHQDDVLRTSVLPGDPGFEYRFRIPATQPPGLYWYHPHMHGFSKVQVLGGASGALIVEGIERANSELAGLPERVLVIRDQDLLNPNAVPLDSGPVAPPVVLDPDGDVRNTGSGTGKPAKDLSVNFIPVPYPSYEPAVIQMKPQERQLWRVLNASAITYLNFQLLQNGMLQGMAVVALDGVPLNYNGRGKGIVWQNHIGLPPGGRAEFIVTAPAGGVLNLVTRSVNTGTGGENDPVRPLAKLVVSADASEPRSKLPALPDSPLRPAFPWLGDVTPIRTRKLYFSETLQDRKDPNSPTTFYITVDGQQPVPFDPNSTAPNIVAHQGDVEDWVIENRSQELHAFHIHQTHFLLLEWFGIPVNEPFLRDTLNVPFWDGKAEKFPSIKLRMDFRDPGIVGTFPFHCHLLEHEDGGMMGLIRIEPADQAAASQPPKAPPVPVSSPSLSRSATVLPNPSKDP